LIVCLHTVEARTSRHFMRPTFEVFVSQIQSKLPMWSPILKGPPFHMN